MKSLFDETRLNQLELKNRLVRSATWEAMADEHGYLTDRLVKVYEELAQGQIALIITGLASVVRDEYKNPGMMAMYDDSFSKNYKQITELVHNYQSKIILQLVSGGSQIKYQQPGKWAWGPSAVPELSTGIIPRPMTTKDIHLLVQYFGDAAYRAKLAGFDGVEIHAAHGYLLSQFLSPYHNQRQDEYGGGIENRARIIFEVYREIRKRVGSDYLVMIKINCEDFVFQGMSFADCQYVCRQLAHLGIDAIEISGGIKAAKELSSGRPGIHRQDQEGYFRDYADRIAKLTGKPVILVGGLRSPAGIKSILAETDIEYFGLSRALLCEADLVRRWASGDTSRAKCTSCNQCRIPGGNICVLNRKAEV